MSAELEPRVLRLEEMVNSTSPTQPGLSMRLDRVERLLSVMLKIGAGLGGISVVWKVIDAIVTISASGKLTPP